MRKTITGTIRIKRGLHWATHPNKTPPRMERVKVIESICLLVGENGEKQIDLLGPTLAKYEGKLVRITITEPEDYK